MQNEILARFLKQEMNEYLSKLLLSSISNQNIKVEEFNFNCFDVLLDKNEGIAVITDILPTDDHEIFSMPLPDFKNLIEK